MADKDYPYRIIDNRSVGAKLPMSVAISIPIEEQLIKEKLEYKNVYMNIRTLFRAFHGSFSKLSRPGKVEMVTGFLEELTNIKAFVSQLGYQVVVYHCRYLNTAKIYKEANVVTTTESSVSRIYDDHESLAVIKAVEENLVDHVCNYRIAGMTGNTAIITHMPIDLLSAPNFGTLHLLETHSGKIKTAREWNTKLGINSKYLSRMPFNNITLQLFGDKAKLFKSSKGNKLKAAVIAMAESKKWTPITTRSKMLLDLSSIDKEYMKILMRMHGALYN